MAARDWGWGGALAYQCTTRTTLLTTCYGTHLPFSFFPITIFLFLFVFLLFFSFLFFCFPFFYLYFIYSLSSSLFNYLSRLLHNEPMEAMTPWYRGFKGAIEMTGPFNFKTQGVISMFEPFSSASPPSQTPSLSLPPSLQTSLPLPLLPVSHQYIRTYQERSRLQNFRAPN